MNKMIEDLPDNAREELKRADHLIFVTLKYTKTAEVIKSVIKRLISAFDLEILELIEFAQRRKKVKKIPVTARLRAEALSGYFPEAKDYTDFYFLLKKIDIAEYTKKEEYRKHVALIAIEEPGKTIEVNMETVRNYFNKTIEFVNFANDTMYGKKEE